MASGRMLGLSMHGFSFRPACGVMLVTPLLDSLSEGLLSLIAKSDQASHARP